MRATDEGFTKEMSRNNLALRFLCRNVQTQAICEWSGLSRARIKKIRQAYAYDFPEVRLRRPPGPAPEKLSYFLRSPRKRCEAAVLGGLCRAFGVIPMHAVPDARRYLPSVSRGEHLCEIYDLYRALVPAASMTMDQLISLLLSLADGERHDIGRCCDCSGVILVDPFGKERRICMHCVLEARQAAEDVRPGLAGSEPRYGN